MQIGDFFFFNDTATTEIYTLSLHDALPIYELAAARPGAPLRRPVRCRGCRGNQLSWPSDCGGVAREGEPTVCRSAAPGDGGRSEEQTSGLQSRQYFVCRLFLEKKKRKDNHI